LLQLTNKATERIEFVNREMFCRIAEGVEQDQKVAAQQEQEKELRRKMKEEQREQEKKAKEAEDIMLGRKTKECSYTNLS
jgi:hypothetical protein